ncbi:VAN3-binding protein [Carex littledalei]|uniref:VAN3-binding protein n=1 Tax=Carex littledalei TaxID=544730 RepID=A0A833RF79_9POAL|nr:VAN3-binding protein [Carex littledalei]
MENRYLFGRKKRGDHLHLVMSLESGDEDRESRDVNKIAVPEISMEPMKFLARSWSASTSGLSKVLISGNRKRNFVVERLPEMVAPETVTLAAAVSGDDWNSRQKRTCRNWNSTHHHSIGGWFHYKDNHRQGNEKTKERARAEQAQLHAAISVAGVAAAVAAVASTTVANTETDATKMNAAMALATELLASHCIEMAKLSGAHHEQVVAAVESAVDMTSPGDLMTLTAAAATALRGAATLKQRSQREGIRSNAAVIPYEKSTCCSPDIWCKEGELLKRTRKGVLHRKKVSVYVNKKSQQVIVKLKSKLMGGAISKKRKGVVYGVYEELPAWPRQERERGNKYGCSFGLRTAQGLIEFECENGNSKRKWVAGINNLLKQVAIAANGIGQLSHPLELECPFQSLKLA